MVKKFILEMRRRNPWLFNLGICIFAFALILILPLLLFLNQISDACYLLKPIKFALSFGIYLWTMAWLLNYLNTDQYKVRLLSQLIAFFILMEIAVIFLQSIQSIPYHITLPISIDMASHYKNALLVIANTMILANTLIVIYIATLFFKEITILPHSYLMGIRLGFLVFIVSCFEGEYILLTYGQVPQTPNSLGLPLANLNTMRGDLLASHFLGIHSLQMLPIIGYLVKDIKNGTLCVLFAASLYLILYGFVFIKALSSVK